MISDEEVRLFERMIQKGRLFDEEYDLIAMWVEREELIDEEKRLRNEKSQLTKTFI